MDFPVLLRACPSCAGALTLDRDELFCLACGYRIYPGLSPTAHLDWIRSKRNLPTVLRVRLP